jgi:hypothetical protein
MVINSTNIRKIKENLNCDGHQFHQYQQNKESLNSDGHQFHQYQQNKESLNSVSLSLSLSPNLPSNLYNSYVVVDLALILNAR